MYSIITFPVVKIVEHKNTFMEETEACLKFYGKLGGVTLAFNVFGSLRGHIKEYGIRPGNYLCITAEIRSYINKNGVQDESYKVLSAVPVLGSEKAIYPTVYFPELKVTSLKQGDATTGKYYLINSEEPITIGGIHPKREMRAWSDGMAEVIEKMKVHSGSRITAAAQVRYSLVPGGGKKMDYTLLSFTYLPKTNNNINDKRNTASTKTEVIETINEPAYKEKIIDMPVKNKAERKPIKIEFSIEDFDQMFC